MFYLTTSSIGYDATIAAIVTVIGSIIAILIKYHLDRKNKQNKEEMNLKQHPYFSRMDILKNQIITSFTLKNKGKEAIFKDILLNRISITQEELLKFVEQISKTRDDELNNSEFYSLVMSTLQNSFQRQATYYLTNTSYTADEREALNKVLVKFNAWNADNIQQLQLSMELISNSCFYITNKAKVGAILDFHTGMSVHTINNAAKTLNSLNGDLEGLVFKGIKL